MNQLLRYVIVTTLLLLDMNSFSFWGRQSETLIDDQKITIITPTDVNLKRDQLIQFIWGEKGFPSKELPSEVQNNVESPIPDLPNLERTDLLKVSMEGEVEGLANYFIPIQKTNRLVVVHQGHACTFNDGAGSGHRDLGMERLISRLLSRGFAVLGVYMPHQNPSDCWNPNHDKMFDTFSGTGSPLKYFLEPVAVSLNYLKSQYQFEDIILFNLNWLTLGYVMLSEAKHLYD